MSTGARYPAWPLIKGFLGYVWNLSPRSWGTDESEHWGTESKVGLMGNEAREANRSQNI